MNTTIQRNWLQRFFQTFVSAHPSVQLLPERHKAELLSALSLSFSLIIFLGLAATIQIIGFSALVAVGLFFSIISFVAYLISRGPFYSRGTFVFVGGFALLAYGASLLGEFPALFLTLTFAILFLLSNLFEFKWMAGFILFNLVMALLLSIFLLPQLQGQEALNVRAGIVTIGLFVLLFAWYRDNLERLRLEEAARAQAELQQSNIELRHAQRAASERLLEIHLAAEVGRTVSQVHDLKTMLTDAVELICTRFNLYYAQIYLVNPSQTYLDLRAGAGHVGKELLARNHRLPLNIGSINGLAAMEKRSVIVSDTSSSTTFKPNPLLLDTRSEMAVPLIIGGKVAGILDIQSEKEGYLSQDMLPAFEALGSQIAIAIQNSNYLAERAQAYAEVETQAKRLSRANWVEYLDAIHKPEETGFIFEQNKVMPMNGTESAQTSGDALTAPIEVTGEALGNLVVELEGQAPISRTADLINTVARQVSQQIENLRLLDSAERYRAEAEEASRRLTRESWKDYAENTGEELSYIYDLKEVRAYNQIEDQQSGDSDFSLPLKVRDETVGKLVVQGIKAGDSDSLNLVHTVAERLGAHIEGLRLSQQTEQAARRERALRQITSAVRGSTDPSTILRAAVRELGTLLGRKTVIRLTTADQTSQSDSLQTERPLNSANESLPSAAGPDVVGGAQ